MVSDSSYYLIFFINKMGHLIKPKTLLNGDGKPSVRCSEILLSLVYFTLSCTALGQNSLF